MTPSPALQRLGASLRVSNSCSQRVLSATVPTPWRPVISVSLSAAEIPTTTTTVSQTRWSSHAPMGPVSSQQTRKPITISTLRNMYKKNEPIAMLTAHDFPSAYVADSAGMDMVLVGDSLAMVALGMNDTNAVTLDDMVLHCKSVTRAVRSAFVVGDLPMGSYEVSPQQAVQSSIRLVKEAHVQAVKFEGGVDFAPTIKAVTTAGIPVVAHIGLTPQRQNALGGFRAQGKSVAGALKLLEDAYAVQEAGAFMVVLEAIPAEIAAIITKQLRIPTIGIGAGDGCSGQVLVQIDMTGNFPTGRHLPKFVKKYANVWEESKRGIEQYRDEVKNRSYPAKEHTYAIDEEHVAEFQRLVDEQSAKKSQE
ncbi:3-methyl-2-oxobutanoate hydroxymethyltransferase [Talaromyces pinophilus]|uniref:3-methyl-2-oxobutanoate hydroxymethyltransferase n=1 Tax=Talaromyces pinophilus TaxID=128442 RepID=A0A6V8H2B6_TALPI|nr:3-methyl-2-oxobutanoate hydroxymethyltransferase [Talaromyces pinophilus]